MEFSREYRKTICRKKCCVKGCGSAMNKNKNLSFHRVAKTGMKIERKNVFGNIEIVDKRAEWFRKLNIIDHNQEVIVCSKHFMPDDYCFPEINTTHRVLKKNAVPTLVKKHVRESLEIKKKKRQALLETRNSKNTNNTNESCLMKEFISEDSVNYEATKSNVNVDSYTNYSADNSSETNILNVCDNGPVHVCNLSETSETNAVPCKDVNTENCENEPENHDESCGLLEYVMDLVNNKTGSLDLNDSAELNENENESNDKGIQVQTSDFFMTLPSFVKDESDLITLCNIKSFKILDELAKIMDETYPRKKAHAISTRDSIILTTAKLKLDINFNALAVFFKPISVVTIRNTFYDTVRKLASILQCVISRVSKEEIQRNMPTCFQKFQDTTSVLDCTEINIQTPKCLKCKLKFYSHYKSHLTVKFMTEVTPAGLITDVSESFGGRASDKIIFNHSDLLQHLESTRDAIMVDRGFLIDNECMQSRIKLIRPPYLKDKLQYSKEEAINNKEIACARVHIERVNQRIKQFQILNHNYPWHLINYIDDIFIICCGFANLDTPILADDKFLAKKINST